jgi:hypothetical protein
LRQDIFGRQEFRYGFIAFNNEKPMFNSEFFEMDGFNETELRF